MKTSRLLLAAILASAIAAPIDSLAEDKSVAQPMARCRGSTCPLKVSFLH